MRQPGVNEEIEALKTQIATLQNREEKPTAVGDDDAGGYGNDVDTAAEWMSTGQSAQRTAEQRLALNTAFEAETFDEDWSTDVTQALQRAIASEELSDASVRAAECRSTLCRVDVEHQGSAQSDEFELWFGSQIADVLPRFSLFQEEVDGRAITVVYLARDSHRLPNRVNR